VRTYADKEIRDECVGITNDADKKQCERRVRMYTQMGAAAMMYVRVCSGEAGQNCWWCVVRRQCSCAAGATWPTFLSLSGVASRITRYEEIEEREYATYASESESSVSRLLATLLCSPSESSLWLRGSALGRLMYGTGGISSLGST